MAIAEAVLEALALRVEVDDPLTYLDGKEVQGAYYQLRHESERALADCEADEDAPHATLLALHGYEHSQIEEAAFLCAVAAADQPVRTHPTAVPPALRAGIAFRMAFSAYFYRRWSQASEPVAIRRLAASFLFQLVELNRYLADYQHLPVSPKKHFSTPASLAQLRLEI